MRDRAEKMRQAKFTSATSSNSDRDLIAATESPAPSVDLSESLQLPGPTGQDDEFHSESVSESESEEDRDVTTDSLQDEFQGVYDDWIFGLDRDDRKMMAMFMYGN